MNTVYAGFEPGVASAGLGLVLLDQTSNQYASQLVIQLRITDGAL